MVCRACGSQLPPGSAFCDHCGTRLASQSPAPASSFAPRPQMPQAYTPKHLAEKILSSKSGLEGERKLVTVLFADLIRSGEHHRAGTAHRP
jgi:predicted amidophosphoribosyltransferase